MTRIIAAIAAGLLLIGTSACGADDEADHDPVVVTTEPTDDASDASDSSDVPTTDQPMVDPAGSACPVGDADCYETGAEAPADAAPGDAMCPPDVTDCVDTAAP